ncbi:VOC family protein [Rhizobium halophytocola]|uniref:Extradiol dioxygenase family protein n=1 Tax=Rhizobium halophytocola TaxID=735519 RepID=A0ABS4DX04_9HYPH|nr:VOC family protein [Rhizobium halophytocola]MBP1850231.1 extradiol dioxygenase family protein [Rhizobium halophytocola]
MRPFHLAFPVTDLAATRRFYGEVLGCKIGRESPGHWVDFDLFGHQLSAHLRAEMPADRVAGGAVDGDVVPIPHFGVILAMGEFLALVKRLDADPSTRWGLKPKLRFEGESGEQRTMFIYDPSGNALEFKAFADDLQIFAV